MPVNKKILKITKEEYDKEIQSIISRSRRYEQEVAEHFRKKKEVIFNEMEALVQWNTLLLLVC